ncbi:MAG TPA: DUF2924 domain-containing protein [Polyangiaceae bacterium]|nr:DUF2924 domain-containing protein [Polyangiaceae bacterium]
MTEERPGADRAHLGRVQDDLRALATMSVNELRARYADLFGEPSQSRNKAYLQKKLARRLQERAEGGLSERARARAAELAPEALGRLEGASAERARRPRGTRPAPAAPAAPAEVAAEDTSDACDAPATPRDPREPPVGATLRRAYRGVTYAVRVVEGGYVYRGERYGSLSSVAKAITGTSWNGFVFFRAALAAASGG